MRLSLSMMRSSFFSARTQLCLATLAFMVPGIVVSSQTVPSVSTSENAAANAKDVSLSQAMSLANSGRFADAEKKLRADLSAHPGDSKALYLLGSVLQRENKPQDSLAAYTEAARGATPTPEDLRIIALDYVLLDDYPDAIHWLERAVAGEPSFAEAWYDLARAHMMQQDFPAAEIDLKRSLSLIPKPDGSAAAVKAENNLGITYEGEGHNAEAADAYRTAIAWQSSLPHPSEQPLLNYGKLLIDQNRTAEAVAPLKEAVRIAPNDPKCHEQLARALERSGSKDGSGGEMAQAEMLEAIRLDPSNARLHFQLGLMYRRAGKPELSKQQMELSGSLYGSHSTASDQ